MKFPTPRILVLAIRELGPRVLLDYAIYAFQLKSGIARRRTRPFRWEARPLRSWLREAARPAEVLPPGEHFLFAARGDPTPDLTQFQIGPDRSVTQEADEILSGRLRLFGAPPRPVGFPPNWGLLPGDETDGGSVPLDRHWTEYDLEDRFDYRSLWEPARFGWSFVLGRAYRLTGDPRYREGFFQLLGSWLDANQPNLGPHWASAQEVAIRTLGLLFAYFAFSPLPVDRQDRLLAAVAAHAARLPATLRYARAQRNNHLINEAVALYSVGTVFPGFREASRWRRLGRRWLVHALRDQVFGDGGYIQHSTNYQRLALSAGLWAVRLAEVHQDPLPEAARQALAAMTGLLIELTDPDNGQVPNLGHNDGSNLLPLAACDWADYRPVLQAASLALLGRRAFSPGPWDELAYWLGVPILPAVPPEQGPSQRDFPGGGLYLLRGEQTRASLRCVRFTARPSHSDQLHFDLWWKGVNVVRDPGTHRYGGGEGIPLAAAKAHNGVLVDGTEPMRQAGRFLWLNWSQARFLARSGEGPTEALAAEHGVSGVTHRRSIVHSGDALWVVIDELLGQGAHTGQVHWVLPDWEWELDVRQLTLEGAPGRMVLIIEPDQATLGLYRAGRRLAGEALVQQATQLGWWAPRYGSKEPALSLIVRIEGELPARLATWWRLGSEGLAGLALAYAQDQLALL